MCGDIIVYIFGYGSLIWRPGFPYLRKFDGYIKGWRRVFWQASMDHRGTPEQPGRVVTLIKDPESETWGTVYCVPDDDADVILRNLDYREKGGYVREEVDVFIRGVDTPFVKKAVLYMATEKNTNYIGETPLQQLADRIYKSVGPSGPNVDYLFNLAECLKKMNVNDEHVFELDKLVRTLIKQTPLPHHTHHSLIECTTTTTQESPRGYTSETISVSISTTTVAVIDEKEHMQRKYFLGPHVFVKGVIVIDDGAVMAVSQRGRSLLAAGIVRVEGRFNPHDLVSVHNSMGQEISRGVTNYSSEEIEKIIGLHSSKITTVLGFTRGEAIIHHHNAILI